MNNDEAVNPTSAATVATVEPEKVEVKSEAPKVETAGTFVFNIPSNWPNTDQNRQPATIGTGTLPAKPTVEETPAKPEEEKPAPVKLEKIERKDGKLVLTQDRLNAIIAAERADAEKAAQDREEAVRLEAERQAREAAANTVEEIRSLWQEDKQAITGLNETILTLKSQIQEKERETLSVRAQVEVYQSLIDDQIDRKVAAWPDQVKNLDPKAKAGESYSMEQVAGRMQWVTDMDSLVQLIANQQTTPAAPPSEPTPPVEGNGPTPEPEGTGDLDAETFIKQERDAFARKFNGNNFL